MSTNNKWDALFEGKIFFGISFHFVGISLESLDSLLSQLNRSRIFENLGNPIRVFRNLWNPVRMGVLRDPKMADWGP